MYATTKLTPSEQSKVAAPGYVPLTWDELLLAVSLPSGERPRTYGYLEDTHEIINLSSLYYVEKYTGTLSFAWISGTTIADLIQRKSPSRHGERV